MLSTSLMAILFLSPGLENGWEELLPQERLEAFNKPSKDWVWTTDVSLDGPKENKLKSTSTAGPILVNGAKEVLPDLLTKKAWGDHEIHLEFLLPKGSKCMGIMKSRLWIHLVKRN